MNLLDKEYFHLGTDKIYKELWLYPQMEQKYKSYIKPYGGLWTSNINSSLCDWISYKEDTLEGYPVEELYLLKSSLIKFKNESKFLIIENENDYKNLKDSGFIKVLHNPIIINKLYYEKIVYELIDYEKLCELYDLLYVNHMAHSNLNNFSVRTMYALKPEAIEYFKPLEINFNENKIVRVKDKEFLCEPNEYFYKFIEYVKSLFSNVDEVNYELFIDKLLEETKKIVVYLKNNIDKLEQVISKDINKYYLIDTVVRNIYREKYLEKQKSLVKK